MRKLYWEYAKAVLSAMVLAFLFYRNFLWMLVSGVPIAAIFCYTGYQRWRKNERWQLNLEFKEGLQGIAAALNAGYSMENALEESRKDVAVIYGEDSVLCRELRRMTGQLQLNRPLEEVLEEFAGRCDVQDIRSFVEVCRTARHAGGDLVDVTRNSARQISEKIEVSREIHTMIAGKQLEGNVMNIVPLGIILYFWICSPGYLDCLYDSFRGHLIMTCFLAVYLAAYFMNQKICHITVS